MKKLLAAATGLLLVVTFSVPMLAQAVTMRETQNQVWAGTPQVFPDVPSGHPNYNAVAMFNENEVIKGYPDGTFKPDGAINRAELTKMVVAWFAHGADMSSYKECFPDVKTEWFAPYVCYAKSKGWVSGYPDGTFKPANAVNRVEAIKIVFNVMIPQEYWPSPTEAEKAYPSPADAESGAWYSGYLAFGIAKELLDGQHVTGDETEFYYKPGESMTRKEVAEMMYRVYLYMVERVEYVDTVAAFSCLLVANPTLPEEEVKTMWLADIGKIDMTEDDANMLTAKYGEDDVASAMLIDAVKECSGQEVDMSKWDFLRNYGA